jgi:perosamine synthetase
MYSVFEPRLTFKDKTAVFKTLMTNNISGTSPVVEEFEAKCANKFDRKYGIAVSNGSVALDLALQLLDLKEGDEVIIPSFTIISCLSAVIRTKAKPVFCDVDNLTWNMSLENVQEKITDKTKAIIVVHTYGLVCDVEKIKEHCVDKEIKIIEDTAEAHGQYVNDSKCGTFGDISTLSFYANKHITTGEGGLLLTDSDTFYEKAKEMRNLGFNNTKRFQHENFYWNYRLSGIQAALGISQINSLEKTIKQKQIQGEYYQALLSEISDKVQLPLSKWKNTDNHYWVFGIVLKVDTERDNIMFQLAEQGVQTRPFFWPLHKQEALRKIYKTNDKLPVSEYLGKNGFYIPIGNHINKKDQQIISDKISKIIQYID